jgi:hypothetical protein
MENYNYTVETKEAGQRRPYGDGYYHYIITDNNHNPNAVNYQIDIELRMVKRFCTEFLDKAIPESDRKEHIKKNGFGGHFTHYYTSFKKISGGIYEYKVVSPSTH